MSGGGSPVLSDEQRAAVERREGDLLLAAGAGSGKTTVLVERFVAAVREDGVEVGRLLAITFTEKAAAELQGRIRRRFLEHGEDERARETEGGAISTIHGFCARLLRAHPLLAGIDPRFYVLEATQADRLERSAFAAALEDFLGAGGSAALDLVAAYGAERLRSAMLDVHAELRSRGEAVELPPLLPRPPVALVTLVEELQAAASELGAELGAAKPGVTVTRALDALEAGTRCLPALTRDEEPPLPSILEELTLPKGNGHALASEACARYRSALAALLAVCRDHHAAAAYALMGDLLRRHAARYAAVKAERSALDFADLELGAFRLLFAHPNLRERFAARFAQVMVDEFQDTNALQLRLLGLLARENLFTVGDELQSIYGFRHAEVELFRDRRATLAPAGRALTLTRNYRARLELLDALNAAFAPVFGAGFTPLRAGRGSEPADPPGSPPRLELLVTDCGADWSAVELVPPGLPGAAQPWRLAEARLLAQRVRELIDAGHAASEVVVLLRATGDLGLYERALEDQGVPTYVIGGRGYWAHRQVQDLIAYLSVLANPREALRLYEVLASPLVGVSSDALVLMGAAARERGRDPWSVLRAAFAPAENGSAPEPIAGLGAEDRARLARAVPWLVAERRSAPRRSLEALLDRALSQTGYDLAVLRMPGGPRRLANARKLMRLAREHEAREGRDLRGFLDAMAERAGEDLEQSRETEAPVEGEALDAVRVMTIHRAKGLEFDVVCVADLGRQPPAGGQELLRLGRDGRVGMRLATLDGSPTQPALAWEEVGAQADAAAAEEEERLFWVAMTRARERLILSGGVRCARWPERRRTSPPLAWIGPAFVGAIAALAATEDGAPHGIASHPDDPRARVAWTLNRPDTVGEVLRRESLAPVPGEEQGEIAASSPGGTFAATPVLPAALAPRPLSYSALERAARCGYRFYLEDVLGLPEREEPASPDPAGGLAPTARGSIVHALLERLDLAAPSVPNAAEITAVAGEHGAVLGAEEAEELGEMVAGFGASELCARLSAARGLRREERFVFALESPGVPRLSMTGAFDAIGWEGERALIVDYKTNRLAGRSPEAVVEESYGVQRLVYALAALRAGAREAKVAFAFLERPEEPVSRTFAAAEAPTLERELAARAAALHGGAFPVSDAPGWELCRGCPGRGTLCSHSRPATEQRRPALAPAA